MTADDTPPGWSREGWKTQVMLGTALLCICIAVVVVMLWAFATGEACITCDPATGLSP